jgi:DNA-binding NarL/FixJ family response regulator
MKRLLIVADHSLIVEAIRLALRHTADFRIVGYVDGRATVSQVVEKAQPDIVLVDDMQRREDALARIGEVQEEEPDAMVILLTSTMEREWLAKALDAGADGIICKAVHPVSLATLLRETVHGNVFHSFAGTDGPNAEALRDCPLTARELEILGLVAEGGSNGVIAQQLWVTEQTVKFHLSNIYRKLGVANRTEASHYAHVHNLLPSPRQHASDRAAAAA